MLEENLDRILIRQKPGPKGRHSIRRTRPAENTELGMVSPELR